MMKRRSFTKLLCASAGSALLASRVKANGTSQPNLLFVFPDQMRMHAMGIWSEPGYDHLLSTVGDPVYTPHINQLAKDGVLFTQAYSCRPVCSPYRAMMMSGMYADRNGVQQNCYVNRDEGLRHDITGFTDVLFNAGYETGYVGKVHWEKNEKHFNSALTYVGPGGGYSPHNYDTYIPPGPGRHGNKFWFQHLSDSHNDAMSYANQTYLIAGKADGVMHRANRFTPEHEADIIVDFINNENGERDISKPFSMFWAPNPPHSPYSALSDVDPTVYNAHYAGKTIAELGIRDNFDSGTAGSNIRYYFSNVTSVDQHLGRILQALEDNGLADNTIVVFTSDHGEMMGSNGLMTKNKFYDEAYLVPFILRYTAKAAHRVEDLRIGPVDLMPTLLGMMGLQDQIPLSVQGVDYSKGILTGDYSGLEKPPSSPFMKAAKERGVRTEKYAYKVIDPGAVVLHDLVNDPYQMTEISAASIPAADLDFLKSELGRWLKKAEDAWYISRTYPTLVTYPDGDNINLKIDQQQVTFDVPKDGSIRVEAKDHLTNTTWQTVGNHTSPTYASRQAHPIDASSYDQRFYRAVEE